LQPPSSSGSVQDKVTERPATLTTSALPGAIGRSGEETSQRIYRTELHCQRTHIAKDTEVERCTSNVRVVVLYARTFVARICDVAHPVGLHSTGKFKAVALLD